jgi:hypothetical protein
VEQRVALDAIELTLDPSPLSRMYVYTYIVNYDRVSRVEKRIVRAVLRSSLYV